MAADTFSQPVLDYISHGAYPDSEAVASATLSTPDLATVLHSLHAAEDEAKSDIRALSASTAGDIDSWISNAKALQHDILRSREVARQIVQEAEQSEKLKADSQDKGNKVRLLEREVEFNEGLTGTLEHVRHANGLIHRAQDEAVKGDVGKALGRLEDAEASIAGLDGLQSSRACSVLNGRAEELRRGLEDTVTKCWNVLIAVHPEQRTLRVQREGSKAETAEAAVSNISLDQVVHTAKGLEVFDSLVLKLGKDLERAVFRPRLSRPEGATNVATAKVSDDTIDCSGKTQDVSAATLFQHLQHIFEFLASRLPPTITIPLSTTLLPNLTARLEENWLDPALPLTLAEVKEFSPVLERVTALADQIDHYGWLGAQALRDWVSNAPRSWLTKRREAVLGDVRGLVFTGLRETKTVERVETRVVSQDDEMLGGTGQQEQQNGDDDWDTAWDEPEEGSEQGSEKKSAKAEDDDDGASAWDMDDDEPDKQDKTSTDDGGEEDAWGWGDADDEPSAAAHPPSSPASKKPPKPPAAAAPGPKEQELTLRETLTTTLVPDGILHILQTLIFDAETLSFDPSLTTSPIAPAASALYSLPTLALALYRATAPTAYSTHLPSAANMLIYNDASHLASRLRTWQASSHLRLEPDAAALDAFARRAYAAEMEAQRTVLRDLLDGAQGFAHCTTPPFAGGCAAAVDATAHRLRELARTWAGVLARSALLQSLGSLLSTATAKIVTEVEELEDISAPESARLRELLAALGGVKDLFATDGEDGGQRQDMTFVYSPTWLKFQYLAEILDASLADIQWMWREGELSLEFDADEVVELVRALFAESELRRKAIAEIRGGGGAAGARR